MAAPLLEVEELTVELDSARLGRLRVLDGVGFSLSEGETVGVVGETAAGKSTLLRTIAGLLHANERVTGGVVRFRGAPLPTADDGAMQRLRGAAIGLIQSGARARLDPVRKIGRQLVDVMRAHRSLGRHEAMLEAERLLRAVGLPDPVHQLGAYPHELSGGMSQRVVVALALANSPRLLMADEPTAGLDVTIQIQILDLFRELVRETGAGSLLATRDLAQVAHYCDRVVVLERGAVVETGSVATFFVAPQHEHSRYLLRAALAARGEALAETMRAPLPAREQQPAPALEVHELVKHFRTHRHTVHAVNGVSFSILPGEALALVGESGSGKTTVGRCIAGLLEPSAGEIAIGAGRAGLDAHVVFQEPRDSLDPRWTLGRSVEEPLRYHTDLDRRPRALRVRELLDLVGLPPAHARFYPHQVSAGVQQRIAIARAIAVNPKVVVLDEPTSQLDMAVRAQTIDVLVRVQEEIGLAYLFISHDMTAVKMIAHRIAVMYLGRIVELGAAADIFESQINPYGRALLSSVLYPDPLQERGTFPLRGEIPSAIHLPPGCPLVSRCSLARPENEKAVPQLEEVAPGRFSACFRNGEIVAAGGPEALLAADRRATADAA